MATRIELNLPPRLLESARATQAGNRQQLLNREQQTRDAREVRRQLRQAEAQGRTVRGRQAEKRGNGVPEFPLSAGDWLPRRGSPDVAYGYQTSNLSPANNPVYTLWSGNGQAQKNVPITAATSESEPVNLPEPPAARRVVKRFFGVVLPEFGPDIDFTSSGMPWAEQRKQHRSESSLPLAPYVAVFPVRQGILVAVVAHKVRTTSTVETWLLVRGETLLPINLKPGPQKVFNLELVDVNASPQLWNYDVHWLQSFGWVSGGQDVSYQTVQAPTSSYLISHTGVREIATPAAVHSWLSSFSSSPGVAQGLGADVTVASIRGTPQTIGAALGEMEAWSPKWLQLVKKAGDPSTLEARQITALDPITHEPLDLNSGALVPSITVPAAIQGVAPVAQTLLLAWDWGKPNLCKQQLLQLGFSPADLTP